MSFREALGQLFGDADPGEDVRRALAFMADHIFTPQVNKLLMSAQAKMTLPEWREDSGLRKALNLAQLSYLRGKAGRTKSAEQLRSAAMMSLRAREKSPTDIYKPKPFDPEEMAKTIAQRYQGPLFEITMMTPASQRMVGVDNLMYSAKKMAAEGDWFGANTALFKASVTLRNIAKSPINRAEKQQAKIFLARELPSIAKEVEHGFEAHSRAERHRAAREAISPYEPPEFEGLYGTEPYFKYTNRVQKIWDLANQAQQEGWTDPVKGRDTLLRAFVAATMIKQSPVSKEEREQIEEVIRISIRPTALGISRSEREAAEHWRREASSGGEESSPA